MDFKDPQKWAQLMAQAAEKKDEKAGDGEENGKKGEKSEKDKAAEDDDKDPMQLLEEELERQDFDIFGVDDVLNLGTGEPLFASFTFEDWALLSLRFELHLLVHAFKHDCNDSERTGIHPDHLAFYYNKYYKKMLNPKTFGLDSIEEVVTLVRDTVIPCMKVIESQLSDELESNEIFVKL